MDPTKRVKGDDYIRLAEVTPKSELWDGQMTPRIPASADYCALVGRLTGYLGAHVLPSGLGELFASECAFFPSEHPDVILVPDVAFVRADRLPPLAERSGFLHLAPDLAVGVAYRPIFGAHVAHYLEDYLRSGVALAWVVDPVAGRVTVHTPGADERVLGRGDVLDGGTVLPGFRLPVIALLD
jgi:Uma2 family endonuclease